MCLASAHLTRRRESQEVLAVRVGSNFHDFVLWVTHYRLRARRLRVVVEAVHGSVLCQDEEAALGTCQGSDAQLSQGVTVVKGTRVAGSPRPSQPTPRQNLYQGNISKRSIYCINIQYCSLNKNLVDLKFYFTHILILYNFLLFQTCRAEKICLQSDWTPYTITRTTLYTRRIVITYVN